MSRIPIASKAFALALAGLLVLAGQASAAEVKVMISGGFMAALQALAPRYEQLTGDKVVIISGSSMGSSPTAIPARLAKGEPVDVLIMVGEALDGLSDQGKVVPSSRTDVALSRIGLSVRAGAPKPDISTPEGLRRTLLQAHSIAYSASASGVYVSHELLDRLGVAAEVGPKAHEVVTERVATIVARGEADIGFQQISELLPVAGADFVGPLPPELQKVTVYSAGLSTTAQEPARGRALIAYLASPASTAAIAATGMDPAPPIARAAP